MRLFQWLLPSKSDRYKQSEQSHQIVVKIWPGNYIGGERGLDQGHTALLLQKDDHDVNYISLWPRLVASVLLNVVGINCPARAHSQEADAVSMLGKPVVDVIIPCTKEQFETLEIKARDFHLHVASGGLRYSLFNLAKKTPGALWQSAVRAFLEGPNRKLQYSTGGVPEEEVRSEPKPSIPPAYHCTNFVYKLLQETGIPVPALNKLTPGGITPPQLLSGLSDHFHTIESTTSFRSSLKA